MDWMAVQQQEWIFSSELHTPKFSNTAAPCRGHPWPEPPGQGTQCKLTEGLQQRNHFFCSNKHWVAFYPHRKMSSRILFKYKANKKSKPPMQRNSRSAWWAVPWHSSNRYSRAQSKKTHRQKQHISQFNLFKNLTKKEKKEKQKSKHNNKKLNTEFCYASWLIVFICKGINLAKCSQYIFLLHETQFFFFFNLQIKTEQLFLDTWYCITTEGWRSSAVSSEQCVPFIHWQTFKTE